MHRGFAPILVLIIGLAIVLVGSVIYFQLKPKTPPVPESSFLATPTPTDETVYTDPGSANWKTYTNEKYSFSLKHPNLDDSCCSISGPLSGKADAVVTLADKTTGIEGTNAPFNGFSVSVESNGTKQRFEDYVAQEKQSLSTNPFCGGIDAQTSLTIAQRQAIKLTCHGLTEEIITTFSDNQQFLIINKGEVSKGAFDKTFNQILSTFQFVE